MSLIHLPLEELPAHQIRLAGSALNFFACTYTNTYVHAF